MKSLTKPGQVRSKQINDKDNRLLTEDDAIMKRWTEYCEDLYNYNITVDQNVFRTQTSNEELNLPILKEEVIAAVNSLKQGKSPGVDNIPAEFLKAGGDQIIDALHGICQRIWSARSWPEQWTTSLVIPLPKKGNLRMCQNHRTISLISHQSKVMLRIILNRLKSKAEEILSEEQAGFRLKRSTAEQIFNIRVLIEKHLTHQQESHHNFIDFKKAFDRVWHGGLRHSLRRFNIDEGLVAVMASLYQQASSAVLLDGNIGKRF